MEIKAQELWEEKKYRESVEIGKSYLKKSIKDSDEFTEVFLNLSYSLYSASELQLFNEFKLIFTKYISLISDKKIEPPIGYHNHVCLLQQNVLASIFQFYEGDCILEDVKSAHKMLVCCSEYLLNKEKFVEFNSQLNSLVHQISLESKDIYYCIQFKLPFSLPLPNGTYEIKYIKNLQSISVNTFRANEVTSRIGDRYFSDIELKFKGYTHTDNYWLGPNLTNGQEFPQNANHALNAINQLIINAKLADEELRLVLTTYNDIGTISTRQFDGNGHLHKLSLGLGFGGHALVDILSAQELKGKKLDNFLQKLKNSKPLLHDELYSNALIEYTNLNQLGAFYLLNSATEAMVDYFLERIASKNNQFDKYQEYFDGKSYCLECEIYKTNPTREPPRKPIPPSPFKKLKLLQLLDVATSGEVKNLQRSMSKIRSDDLRNDLTHGRSNIIPRQIVITGIKEFKVLKEFFEAKL